MPAIENPYCESA